MSFASGPRRVGMGSGNELTVSATLLDPLTMAPATASASSSATTLGLGVPDVNHGSQVNVYFRGVEAREPRFWGTCFQDADFWDEYKRVDDLEAVQLQGQREGRQSKTKIEGAFEVVGNEARQQVLGVPAVEGTE